MKLLGIVLFAVVVAACSGGRDEDPPPVDKKDAGVFDAGETPDASVTDAGGVDASSPDAGAVDGGAEDAGAQDAGGTDAGTPTTGESCAAPEVITVTDAAISGTTLGAKDDFTSGAACAPTSGPDRVYLVAIPAGHRVWASVTTPDLAFNPVLLLTKGPSGACATGGAACVATADARTAGGDETLTWTNESGAGVVAWLVVDSTASAGTAVGGAFDLHVIVGPPLEGEICASPTAISAAPGSPVQLEAQSLDGFADDLGGGVGCQPGDGADRVYAVPFPASSTMTVRLEASVGFNPSLSIVSGDAAVCAGGSPACVASDDGGAAGGVDAVSVSNGPAATTAFVIVDGEGAGPGGTFRLAVSFATPAANDTCETAQLVTAGASFSASTLGATGNYDSSATCLAARGRDVVYAIDVPGDRVLRAIVAPPAGDTTSDPSVSIVRGGLAACNASPRVCASSNDDGTQSETNTAVWYNAGTSTERVFVVVDSVFEDTFAFTLEFRVAAPLAGDYCETAVSLPIGTTTRTTTVGATPNYGQGRGCQSTAGPDLAWVATVPANKRLTVTSTGVDAFQPSLNLMEGPASNCGQLPRVCVASADGAYDNVPGPSVARWTNGTSGAKQLFVITESAFGTGAFDLRADFDTPPPGDTCETATSATTGTIQGTTVGAANDLHEGDGCKGGEGPDVAYKLTLPPGQVLTATLTPTFDATLDLYAGFPVCAGRSCTASSNKTATTAEVVTRTNRSGSAEQVFLVVDSADGTSGTFSLDLQIADAPPIPTGDSCGNAERITLVNGAAQVNGTLVGYADDFNSNATTCARSEGEDHFYLVDVPPGRTLRTTVTPGLDASSQQWDPALNLVELPSSGCPPVNGACLAGDDTGFGGDAETVDWTNTASVTKTIYVVVDVWLDAVGTGPYTLDVALVP